MLRCREISKLVSESMERQLPFREQMHVKIHLMMCRLCSGFSRQMRLLRRAAHESPDRLGPDEGAPDASLPEEARTRIKAALRNSEG